MRQYHGGGRRGVDWLQINGLDFSIVGHGLFVGICVKDVFSVPWKEGLGLEEVAKRFGIGKTTVFLWTKRLEPQLTRTRKAAKIDTQALASNIDLYPDVYQYERAKRLGVSKAGIWF